jgi:glycosyltransferase involved in cell wall biosynthesis
MPANLRPPIKVLIHGLPYFSRQFPAILESKGWEIRNYSPRWSAELFAMAHQLHRCDLAYSWGGRTTMGKFLAAARLLGKKKVVIFWCGSDVLEGQAEHRAGKSDPWVAERIHWAGAPWLADEVRAMGLKCEYVPITWVPPVEEVSPLPKVFSVLSYLPDISRISLYGIDQVLEVAQKMPYVRFTIAGLRRGQSFKVPGNVIVRHHMPSLQQLLRETTVMWRPTRHDGLSFTVLEALAHGRHVIWSYPITGALLARDAATSRAELERLFDLHEANTLDVNRVGAEFVARNFSPDKIRDEFLSRWRTIVEAPSPSSAHSRGALKTSDALSRDESVR